MTWTHTRLLDYLNLGTHSRARDPAPGVQRDAHGSGNETAGANGSSSHYESYTVS